MRKTVFIAATLLVFAALGSFSVFALRPDSQPRAFSERRPSVPDGDSRFDELDQYFRSYFPTDSSSHSPGFAVLVKQNGKIFFEKGYGVRDLRTNAPIDAKTNFRLASFTKQFTAMAIMLLVRDGQLRYDESLTDILPEFPAYGKNITVRNLLNHTGGLPDYENLMDAIEKQGGPKWSPEKQISDAEVFQLLEKTTEGKFAPGSKWEYSNSGYVVLGLIVAKRSGKSFGEFLHERIFVPVKMEHTLVFEKSRNEVVNRAYGHSAKPGAKKDGASRGGANGFVETDQSSTSATQGDGGIYSNLEDLSKWDDALRNHTVLSEIEFAAAITPAKLPPGAESKLAEDVPESMRGKPAAYGFGWFLNLQDAHPLMWHYGDTMGFKTAIFRYLHDDVTVVLLSNRSDIDQGMFALRAAQSLNPAH